MSNILKGLQLNELSNKKLGKYKTAAGADAKKADSEGDYKRGDKRMSGIIKATKKEFANDEKKVDEAFNNYHANRTGFSRPSNHRDDERHDLDTPTQVWGLKINGKVWSKGGVDVTFTSKQAALNARNAILKNKPDLEIGLVTKGGVAEETINEGVPSDNDMGTVPDARSGTSTKMTLGQWKQMWLKKMPYADQGMFRYPPAMNGSFIAYFDGWENTPGARWDPIKSIEEDELDENCWKGYHKEGNKELFGKTVPNCVKNEGMAEEQHSCPHCGGEMVSEELMNEKKDACYYKVKSRYKVWPSAYASGALVKCRKKGADSWGNGGKKNESSILEGLERADENLHQWFKEKWVRFGPDGKIRGDCARGDDSEGKPKCLPQSKAHNLGKKGRASAASRKRREDPNPERSGKAINVNTKKKSDESIDEGWRDKLGAAALAGSMALGAAGAQARVTPGDDPNINRLNGQPIATQQATTTAPTRIDSPTSSSGFSKEYLQKAADPNRFGRYMISVEKAQELLKQMNEEQLDEKWSQKYKDSINCSNPKGFSQRAHCQGKNK